MKILYEKNGWAIERNQDSEWQKVFAVDSYGIYVFRPELKLMGYSGWTPFAQKKTLEDCSKILIEKDVLTKEEADKLAVLIGRQ